MKTEAPLTALLLAILVMMVLPLPTIVVDTMIGINLSVAVLLIITVLHMHSPLSLTAFPAILLMTTLFRLALSVSTTRLILLDGDAGAIVETFGRFVVGGNVVVGMIVFLILTIVQFIVVTKGAERVAEVGARFSLDALPGKQMAIDGDLRANIIEGDEAGRRRETLGRESQFYGAMDGAMKFVKGDAIAGLVICVVNLLGGVAVGSAQRGLSLGEAASVYSILTIGDGLVSQIPSLLISIAAGIVVTRVAGPGGATSTGRDIVSQLAADPRALAVAGVGIGCFGVTPGMPAPVFAILGAALLTLSFTAHRRQTRGGAGGIFRRRANGAAGRSPAAASVGGGVSGGFGADAGYGAGAGHGAGAGYGAGGGYGAGAGYGTGASYGAGGGYNTGAADAGMTGDVPERFTVQLACRCSEELFAQYGADVIAERLHAVCDAVSRSTGVPIPPIVLRPAPPSLSPYGYRIEHDEVPIAQGLASPERPMVLTTAIERLDNMGALYQRVRIHGLGCEAVLTGNDTAESLALLGDTVHRGLDIVCLHLDHALRGRAAQLIGVQETHALLSHLESRFPDLVQEVQRLLPEQRVSEVLQRLAAEHVSIRNMRAIAEALVQWASREKDVVVLTEYVRLALGAQLTHQWLDATGAIPCYMLTVEIEDVIRESIRQTSEGNYLALDPEASGDIVAAAARCLRGEHNDMRPVVLAPMEIRRYLRKVLELEFPHVPVLAYQEISIDVEIDTLGRIDLNHTVDNSIDRPADILNAG